MARPTDIIVELIAAGAAIIVGLYVLLYFAHVLFGTPDPSGFF